MANGDASAGILVANAATITMTVADQKRPRQQPQQQKNSSLKIFLNRHGHVVDFLSATLLVSLCLIVLLPQVHDSFTSSAHEHHDEVKEEAPSSDTVPAVEINPPGSSNVDTTILAGFNSPSPMILANSDANNSASLPLTLLQPSDEHDHSHHHHHGFPAGEFLVCIGFFVFYCVGFNLEGKSADYFERDVISSQPGRGQAMRPRRRQSSSATCCSSTKGPPRKKSAQQQAQVIENNRLISSGGQVVDELTLLMPRCSQRNDEDDCLMLLNPHHQHHTHSKHHDSAQITTSLSAGNIEQSLYGSTSKKDDQSSLNVHRRHQSNAANHLDNGGVGQIEKAPKTTSKFNRTIIVDEIKIISEPNDASYISLPWPRSLKMLLVSAILAAFLVFFDMKMHGLSLAIKVFRAYSTGALLYVAFFIMLPRDRVDCNSCKEEES